MKVANLNINNLNLIPKKQVLDSKCGQGFNNQPASNLAKSPFNPAYFHPSFCSNPRIVELTKFLDNILSPLDGKFSPRFADFDINRAVLDCFKGKNYIGRGYSAQVYRINEKYVFRTNSNIPITEKSVWVNDETRFDHLSNWCGKVLAKSGNVEFLKNADPKSNAIVAGAPYGLIRDEGLDAAVKQYHSNYLPKILSLGQDAFDDVAKNFSELGNISNKSSSGESLFAFDIFNPNNFVITDDKINIVDRISSGFSRTKDLGSLTHPLMNLYEVGEWVQPDKALFDQKRALLEKLLLASEKNELSLPSGSSKIGHSFALAGLDGKWKSYRKILLENRSKVPSMDERLNIAASEFDKL